MTCIAWDGTTLAADTRKTHRRSNNRADVAVKLHPFERKLFVVHKKTKQAHRVIACAGAGYSMGITRAVEMLEANPEEFLSFHRKLKESGLDSTDRTFSLLFIADQLPFTFRCGNTHLTGPKLSDTTHRMAIGSGGKVAKWLMETYAVIAPLAVAGASLHDPGTGGVIHSLTFEEGRLVKKDQLYYRDRRDIQREIQDAVKSVKIKEEPELAVDSMFVTEPEPPRMQWVFSGEDPLFNGERHHGTFAQDHDTRSDHRTPVAG